MKKILSILLALLLMGSAAFAEASVVSGNISTGGVAALNENGTLWFSMGGLKRLNDGGVTEHILDGSVRCIQYAGDALYFVQRQAETGEDAYADVSTDTLYRIAADGVPVQIGPALRYAEQTEYDPETYTITESTLYSGYTDLTVYGDYIYYIGTDDEAGSYLTDASAWDYEAPVETRYAGSCAVFRMNRDGSGLTKLISGLGNGQAHMAICNDRIAVSSAFRNPVYVYDFVNFMLYDLEGGHLKTIANTSPERHSWIFKEEEEFTTLVNSIQTDGEQIYASLSESEGDFASSRLVDTADYETVIAIEAFYAPALVTPQGLLYITADVEDTFWAEDMEYTTVLRHRAPDGTERILAHIPHTYVGYDMRMALLGDMLYLCSRDFFRNYTTASREMDPEAGVLLRVDLQSGNVDELTEAGFAVSMACDPEFYVPPVLGWQSKESAAQEDYIDGAFLLPDSDVYLYSSEDLEFFSAEELALIRNEILARHGYVFSKEANREYFSGQSWYEENPDFSYDMLNAVEMENVETIKALEAEK